MRQIYSRFAIKTKEWSYRGRDWYIYVELLTYSEAATEKVLYIKQVFSQISQNSQENTRARVSFLIKLQA